MYTKIDKVKKESNAYSVTLVETTYSNYRDDGIAKFRESKDWKTVFIPMDRLPDNPTNKDFLKIAKQILREEKEQKKEEKSERVSNLLSGLLLNCGFEINRERR